MGSSPDLRTKKLTRIELSPPLIVADYSFCLSFYVCLMIEKHSAASSQAYAANADTLCFYP